MKSNLHNWIIGFALIKLLIHLYTNSLYELHRDEYLYIDEGKHLAWGYMEVPPFTPFLAFIGDLLGNQIWIYKLFPAIAGALIIYIIGRVIIELGGGKWAVVIAGVSLLVSPGLLRSASLFQPVIFNQLAWLLCGYWVFKIIRDKEDHYYYYLGITAGIAFLNKYSIVFYGLALILGVLLTTQRKILFKKQVIFCFLLVFLIAFPNILWQWNHNWPVVSHMEELRTNQLVHVHWPGYLGEQLLFHSFAGLVWVVGLIGIFRYISFYKYRSLAFAFLITILIIGVLNGKPYYTMGAFYILFAFGAITLESLLVKKWERASLVLIISLITLPMTPLGAPLVPIQHMTKYCDWISRSIGTDKFLEWEDGMIRSIPQDFADMHGWEELVENTAAIYHNLPDSVKSKTIIYGGSYGHAGAMNFFREAYDLPETYSGNGSYLWWADENAQFENIIVIEEEYASIWRDFNSMVLVDSISNPYARDKGYTYFLSDPKRDPTLRWKSRYLENRAHFQR